MLVRREAAERAEPETGRDESKRTKASDERRCWNQYVAHSSVSILATLPPTFRFFLLYPEAKPLLLVSDFYLAAPGARFISLFSPLPRSFSPVSFSTTLFTFSLLSPTNSPQPRTVRNFLFRILDPWGKLFLIPFLLPPSAPFYPAPSAVSSFFFPFPLLSSLIPLFPGPTTCSSLSAAA